MKRLTIFALAILTAFCASSAFSQDDEYDWEKDWLEVTVNGGLGVPAAGITEFANDNLGAESGFSLGGEIGYFVTYEFIFGLSMQYTQYNVDNDFAGQGEQHHNLYSPALYGKYYFLGESNWEPFLVARVGLDFPKFSTAVVDPAGDRWRELSYDPVVGLGAGAGLFYFTSDFSGLYLEANVHHAFTNGTTGEHKDVTYTFEEDLTTVDVHFGIRLFVGPGG